MSIVIQRVSSLHKVRNTCPHKSRISARAVLTHYSAAFNSDGSAKHQPLQATFCAPLLENTEKVY